MKIVQNEVCYVERKDIYNLRMFPQYVISEINFRSNSKYIKFENPRSINYFSESDFIIDYTEICNLSLAEITLKLEKLKQSLSNLAGEWLYASENLRESLDRNRDYNYKIKSIKYILMSMEKYMNNKETYDEEIEQLSFTKSKLKEPIKALEYHYQ